MTKARKPSDASPMYFLMGDVTAMFRFSRRQVYRLVEAGRMPPPLKIGRSIRWDRETLAAWVAAGCPPVAVQRKEKIR
jgi:excisionase family DNA binding protein